MIEVLGCNEQFPLVLGLTNINSRMQVLSNYTIDFWVVFRAYNRDNLPADAITAFNKMVDFRIQPGLNDLVQLLFSLCKPKHVEHAHQFFDKSEM